MNSKEMVPGWVSPVATITFAPIGETADVMSVNRSVGGVKENAVTTNFVEPNLAAVP
jgi:hypothetical protein